MTSLNCLEKKKIVLALSICSSRFDIFLIIPCLKPIESIIKLNIRLHEIIEILFSDARVNIYSHNYPFVIFKKKNFFLHNRFQIFLDEIIVLLKALLIVL